MTAWRKALPLSISILLLAWLMSRIPVARLWQAAGTLPVGPLFLLTLLLVLGQYASDPVCLQTAFARSGPPLTYWQMLRLRGKSYLAGAVHQGLGQGALAWEVARLQGTSLPAAFSRSILLGWHEALLLSLAALAGSLATRDPHVARARFFCTGMIAFLLLVALAAVLRCKAWPGRFRGTRLGAWLESWTWRRSLRLMVLRGGYFALGGAYLLSGLHVCGIKVDPATALAVVPLVLMASVLPSASGLGTRETALYLLLPTDRPDAVVTIGLIWSAGVLVGRAGIGLAWLWLDRGRAAPPPPRPPGRGAGSRGAPDRSVMTSWNRLQ